MVETFRVPQNDCQTADGFGKRLSWVARTPACNAPKAHGWHRWREAPSHTQGRHYKCVTALFTADLAFGLRILVPPSWQPLLIHRYWHSRGDLFAIFSLARRPVSPVATCVM